MKEKLSVVLSSFNVILHGVRSKRQEVSQKADYEMETQADTVVLDMMEVSCCCLHSHIVKWVKQLLIDSCWQ